MNYKKIFCLVMLSLMIFAGAVLAESRAESQTEFVKSQIQKYEARYGERYAWSRILGCGHGVYGRDKGIEFEWFAYTNTDGLVILVFDNVFFSDEAIEKIKDVDDVLNRPWDVYESQGMTLITTSNDWFFPYFSTGDKWEEDLPFILDAQIFEVSKLKFLKLTVAQHMK